MSNPPRPRIVSQPRLRHHLRGLGALAALLALGCRADGEGAQQTADAPTVDCPGVAGKSVRWIVPFSPGGGHDVDSRLLEPFYEEVTGAEVVVQNRVGAGGRVGARAIRDAEPDGQTLGIVNATALLVTELSEEPAGLHPVNDFTVLGRIAAEDPIWVTGPRSGYRNMEDVLTAGDSEPILFGVTAVGGAGFVFASVAAELLGLEVVYLAGYPGSREYSLGLMRGEIDFGAFAFESIVDRVEAGDLRPVLQISDKPVSDHPSLRGIPFLAGPDGLAARRARERGGDPELVILQAAAFIGMFETGRLVVAPPGLAPELTRCLSTRLAEVVQDSAFMVAASNARRPITFEEPATVAARLEARVDEFRSLAPILHEHIARARGPLSGR